MTPNSFLLNPFFLLELNSFLEDVDILVILLPLAWVCRCEVVKYVQTFCSSTYHAHRGGRTIIFRIFYDAEYLLPNAETRNPKPTSHCSLLSKLLVFLCDDDHARLKLLVICITPFFNKLI